MSYLNTWVDKKRPIAINSTDYRGVTDWGNLMQFAPYESGYCFLVVIGAPMIGASGTDFNPSDSYNFNDLQKNFINILETQFKGLSGLEDYSTESYTVGINNSQQEIISKVKGASNANISMTFNEMTGTPINTYLTEYLKRVRNPYTGITAYNAGVTYTGKREKKNGGSELSPYNIKHFREVFTMLYIITDSTCLNVEKAFALINCRPTNNADGELYSFQKGDIGTKEITINWTCSVRESNKVNHVAQKYLHTLVNTGMRIRDRRINVNSYEYNWTISGAGAYDGAHESARLKDMVVYKAKKETKNEITHEVGLSTSHIFPSAAEMHFRGISSPGEGELKDRNYELEGVAYMANGMWGNEKIFGPL